MNNLINLDKDDIIIKVNELKEQYAKQNIILNLNPDNIHEYCQLEYWYSGTIASFEYLGRYLVSIEANGDIEGSLIDEDGTCLVFVKDKNNLGEFYSTMKSYIKSDKELLNLLDNANNKLSKGYKLILNDNNWLELSIFDQKKKSYININSTLENAWGVLDINYDDVIELVNYYIEKEN